MVLSIYSRQNSQVKYTERKMTPLGKAVVYSDLLVSATSLCSILECVVQVGGEE